MKLKISILFILVIFASCNASIDSKDEQKQDADSLIIQKRVSSQKYVAHIVYDQPLIINEIKSLDNILFTSGIVPHSDTNRFCKPDSSIFFGFYILINKELDEQIGTLYIHTTDSPENWRADSKNEKFESIRLFSDDIVIWDSLKVGLSENELKQFVAKQFHYKKGQTIYADFDEFEGFFTIRNDSVVSLEINTKCLNKN
ncbi:hypothetical protein C9994_03535 [Marivirga lumbricoides]|uniref:Lipoprotein n=1 Tax=Marivirga lumbricoides TaxID=1046115 RepID=A0A2T4DTU9_9BACT|nr:hypothetical protein C9994_03535 [Marivirga lumbricoides]